MSKRKPYDQLFEGEWTAIPRRGHRNQCCDCGLVHVFRYRLNADKQIEINAKVDRRATAAVRRAFKFSPEN